MTLCAQLTELVSACFTGIWVLSHEHQDALTEIAQARRAREKAPWPRPWETRRATPP